MQALNPETFTLRSRNGLHAFYLYDSYGDTKSLPLTNLPVQLYLSSGNIIDISPPAPFMWVPTQKKASYLN